MAPVVLHVDWKDGRQPDVPLVRSSKLDTDAADVADSEVPVDQQLMEDKEKYTRVNLIEKN